MSCRLLYIVGGLVQGGLEQQLCYLLGTMDRARYRPAVVVWNYRESDPYLVRFRDLGIPLYCFTGATSRVAKLSALRRLVRQLQPEVIHSYSFYTNFGAEWGGRGAQAIRIGSIRGEFTRQVQSSGPWLGRLCARWPRDQICNSRNAAEAVGHSGPFLRPSRLFVVPNGLDLQRFRVTPLPAGGPAAIVGLGALQPLKRWDRLLDAVGVLRRAGMDCTVRIVGEGPCRTALENQARELGIAEAVALVGYQEDIPGILSEATFLVHTSDSEGCPNAVMEAMASGRVVVATDAGDVPQLVEEGRTGFVVRRGDEEALVRRMASLIGDRELCVRMGRAGRAKAEREFGLDRLVAGVFHAYEALGWACY